METVLQSVREFLFARPHYQLLRIQKSVNCRVDGSKACNADLRSAIAQYAEAYGLTSENLRDLAGWKRL